MRPAHRRTWSVSNPRPGLVSGPDVPIRSTAPGSVVLRADAHPAEGLTRQADGSFLGLVRGLRPGLHHLVAESGRRQAAVTVIDHAASGPVFSGPQQQPFAVRLVDTRSAGGRGWWWRVPATVRK